MKKVFVDMDGTIAEWNKDASIEEVASPGYFLNRIPMPNMISGIRLLTESPDIEVYILSSVFTDNHSIREKCDWLDRFLPEVPNVHRLFVPYGEDKFEHVRKIFSDGNASDLVLIDDFTQNLKCWKGIGIKCLNGINNTNGTWTGYLINGRADSKIIYNTIAGILKVA